MPTSSADFTALGITPANASLLLCQEASGNLIPTIGSAQWAPGGSGHLYQQTVAGWSRFFIGLTETSALRWSTTDSSLDIAAGESYAVLMYASAADAAAATRTIFQAQGATDLLRIATGGIPATLHNSAASNLAGDHGDLAIVRPWVWYRNATTNESGAKTDLAEVIGTHDESARTGVARSIGSNGSTSAAMRCCLQAIWKGAAAEQNWKTVLQTLGWALSY